MKTRTGAGKEFVKLASVPERWAKFPRKNRMSAGHKANGMAVLNRFVAYMNHHWPQCKDLIDVRERQVAAFLEAESARGISARTWNVTLGLLKSVFAKLEPSADAYTQYLRNAKQRTEQTVHRQPFTAEEVERILEAAKKDEVLRGPVHVACFTALRKGDACCLKWEAVDLKAGMIQATTSKTGERVEIPILPPLAEELSLCTREESEYVFPKAARMYLDAKKRSTLNTRFKAMMADAGFVLDSKASKAGRPPLPRLTPEETRKKAERALELSNFQSRKKEKMRKVLDAYLEGKTLPEIAKRMKISKSTVSLHLNTMEEICHCAIYRHRGPTASDDAIQTLAAPSEDRLKRGSKYGWHSFRTTFITQALSAGMPEELVRRVTGHSAVDIVRKHYFRPNTETFRREFARVADGFYQPESGGGEGPDLERVRGILKGMTARTWKEDRERLLKLLSVRSDL
ncbi:MAG: tyrosine-type recombinase/integrase [Verrucomicrobia bacterium]|nr:tyrosine-type recombinase/integrase [Verrucomicrobiota bacterium]MCH8510782.1 tyrosine-type recombinase/integrase [Kiritimatiellia bacterium]